MGVYSVNDWLWVLLHFQLRGFLIKADILSDAIALVADRRKDLTEVLCFDFIAAVGE